MTGALIAIAAIVGSLVLIALLETKSEQVQCVDAETQEKIIALTLQAYYQALFNHTMHLFDVWMKEPGSQPTLAQVGTQNGISAYVRARKMAEVWSPPVCG